MVVERDYVNMVFETKEKLDPYQARLYLMEAYQMTYGIFDHIGQAHKERIDSSIGTKKPLSLVAMHESETLDNTHLTTFLTRYAESNVFEIFHLTIDQLLCYPRAVVDEIFKITSTIGNKKAIGLDSIEKVLKNAAAGK